MPLFFIVPRYGSNALARAGEGLAGFVGFSDTVSLGDIGRLQQSNASRDARACRRSAGQAHRNLRWRGVALDNFNGREWQRSRAKALTCRPTASEISFSSARRRIASPDDANFFVEPIDTPVLFAAPRAVAVQGAFPYVRRDREDALSTRRHDLERISYIALLGHEEPEQKCCATD